MPFQYINPLPILQRTIPAFVNGNAPTFKEFQTFLNVEAQTYKIQYHVIMSKYRAEPCVFIQLSRLRPDTENVNKQYNWRFANADKNVYQFFKITIAPPSISTPK